MRVTLLSSGGPFADILDRRQADRDRAWIAKGGTHYVNVSRIVWDMVQVMEGKDPELAAPRSPEAVMIEMGFLMEELLAEELAKRSGWSKPPAKFRDGIGARSDGWSPSTRTVDEIKVTRMSAVDGLDNPSALRFVLTAHAYAAIYRTDRVRLHVWYVNGDYRPPRWEQPRTFICRIGAAEAERTWAGIRGHAADRGWLRRGSDGRYRPTRAA